MALILDATVGGSASNSYSTQLEGDNYHDARLFSTSWTDAIAATKDAALVWATRIIDYSFDWEGFESDPEVQALRWPRFSVFGRDSQLFDSDEIPLELKDAVAELARLLIDADRTAETGTEGIIKLKVDVIALEFDKLDRIETIPDEVYQMISHLGRLKSFSTGGGSMVAVPLVRS